jgi:hypothetical protein
MHPHHFDHDNPKDWGESRRRRRWTVRTLDVYRLLAGVARWYLTARFPRGAAKLKSQGSRAPKARGWRRVVHEVDPKVPVAPWAVAEEAAQSAALNTAEGRGRAGQARRNHYEIALASAAEACAALDLADVPGGPDAQQKLRRAGAMLKGLGG